jgi:hypothetical protein
MKNVNKLFKLKLSFILHQKKKFNSFTCKIYKEYILVYIKLKKFNFFYKLEIHSKENKNKKLVRQEHNPIKRKKKLLILHKVSTHIFSNTVADPGPWVRGADF